MSSSPTDPDKIILGVPSDHQTASKRHGDLLKTSPAEDPAPSSTGTYHRFNPYAIKKDTYLKVFELLGLCDALVLAAAYTICDPHLFEDLLKCDLAQSYANNLAFLYSYGLACLVISVMAIVCCNMLQQFVTPEDQLTPVTRAWRYYMPWVIIQIVLVIILFVLVAIKIKNFVSMGMYCKLASG